MRHANIFVGLMLVALAAVGTAPPTAADNYTLTTDRYSENRTLLTTELWDTYELTASIGRNVIYSMNVTTPGGCAMLLYVKGHNANPQSNYYRFYSQEACVPTYSNTFPVESADGTEFTVLIATQQSQDINYSVSIRIESPRQNAGPVVPGWLLSILILVVIGVVVGIVGSVAARRRRAARIPPVVPPGYIPPPPGQPSYPQQFPPPYAAPYPPPPPAPSGPSPVADPAAALRAAYREGRLDRRLFAENLARTLGVAGDVRASRLVDAFVAARIDLDLFERNLRSLQPAS